MSRAIIAREDFLSTTIRCAGCHHLIGHVAAHGANLTDLMRLSPDPDGTPRYGLRPGAWEKGRDPLRVDPAVAARDAGERMGDAWDTDVLPLDGVNGSTFERRFYAMCRNCGRKNLVDLRT